MGVYTEVLEFIYKNYDPDNIDDEKRVLLEYDLIKYRDDDPCKKCNNHLSCISTGCDKRYYWWENAKKEETEKWRKEYKKRHNKTDNGE